MKRPIAITITTLLCCFAVFTFAQQQDALTTEGATLDRDSLLVYQPSTHLQYVDVHALQIFDPSGRELVRLDWSDGTLRATSVLRCSFQT